MKRVVLAVALLATLLMGRGVVLAEEDPHAACAAPPTYIPPDLLERPVPLRQGIGNSHETVGTASKEAQAFYDQGLNYLESYVWIEASRSFHQALRLDPKLAMAYVGLSRVHSGLEDPAGAKAFLEKGQALAAGAPPRDRRILGIRAKQLAAMEKLDDQGLFLAYKQAIDEALAADTDDAGLWILRGNAEESNASGRGQRGGAASTAFYARALALVPDHATAHHFLVHSYETIGRIDKALEHGEAYARLAPAIPHAAHMWAHDLRRVGRVDDAIVQFKKADELERAYYAAEKIDPAMDWHHAHNLGLLAGSYEHKGQLALAEKVMREAAAIPPMEAYRAFSRQEYPSYLIRRGRYDEALETARAMTKSLYPQARTVGHVLAGQALLALKRKDEAAAELEAAKGALEEVPVIVPGIQPRRSMVQPWVDSLRGELLLRTGKVEEGAALLKQVQSQLRAIPGPDAWTQTLFRLETMAAAARDAGAWDFARHTASVMLEHDAAYGGSHLAMALVLKHEGDEVGAARENDEARRCWKDADPEMIGQLR